MAHVTHVQHPFAINGISQFIKRWTILPGIHNAAVIAPQMIHRFTHSYLYSQTLCDGNEYWLKVIRNIYTTSFITNHRLSVPFNVCPNIHNITTFCKLLQICQISQNDLFIGKLECCTNSIHDSSDQSPDTQKGKEPFAALCAKRQTMLLNTPTQLWV